ncbi:MAG: hypothetical protein WC845_01060 [Candidatus Staskawiczbacteria bacterium]|jgi:hypothetical protein
MFLTEYLNLIGQIGPLLGSVLIVFGLEISESTFEHSFENGKEFRTAIVKQKYPWILKMGIWLLTIGSLVQTVIIIF